MRIRSATLAVGLATILLAPTQATAAPTAIPRSAATKSTVITIGAGRPGRTIPAGFLGLSIEYTGLWNYEGGDPTAPNPVLIQLIRNLTPGQRPVLRIGGDSTDWTWWPVTGVARPPGIRFVLTQRWMEVTHALAQALNARMIMGVNLEADSGKVAGGEAQALLNGLGSSALYALELGNEPELYTAFPWYMTPSGKKVFGRSRSWTYSAYARDFGSIVRLLPRVPLAGPSIGSASWSPFLGSFLRSEPRVSIATLHRYPLKRCTSAAHLTVGELLSAQSATGLADGVIRYVNSVHAHHIPLRIDEMNSVSCGGQRGLSDTYTASLWALDALYEMARVGVDGVNIHTAPNAINEMFRFQHSSGGWSGSVRPVYYGLLAFARAAPAGSRIQSVSGTVPSSVRVWATRASDGSVRVVLINDAPRGQTIKFRAPRAPGSSASVAFLRAPSVTAQSGITLGGQGFGAQTTTGQLAGPQSLPTIKSAGGTYGVSVPGWSAAILTIGAHQPRPRRGPGH